MTEITEFQDRANLEHIRENLFKNTEFGRVSVMIGAGFSRNAEKFSPQIPDFPLARDLGKIIYSKLHPDYDFLKSTEKINFGENFDKYASEYSKKFGQGELYDLLIKSIPDEKYLPGEIHKLLLELPWSDIFTTNYDTLLERASQKIYSKKYDIVKKVTQIPLKSKPRIVKLHGDIPSHSFIITEDDYKDYPENYGAFQNLVQESIIENVFCLIGFGGKDKNFTLWKKWVRDKLGDHSPPIYLCGVFGYTEEERGEYENEKENIKIIDLGPLFPKDKFPDSNIRHKLALEWFLKSLALGEPNNKLKWPNFSRREIHPIKNPLAPPLCPLPPDQLYENIRYIDYHFGSKNIKADIENNCKIWTIERGFYPGWILAPRNNREELWRKTKDFINPILKNIHNFEFPSNLHLLFELLWRLESSLTPLFSNVAECVESEIKKINPFPDLITINESENNPLKEKFRELNWDLISRQWVELAYYLVRYYRESNNSEKYHYWINLLEKINILNSNWKNKWYYENCLFALFQLNQEKLRSQLNKWTIDDDHPEYLLKKAGLLSELGELEKSKTIAEQALHIIRLHLHSNRDDFFLFSLEGWCILLLQSIDRNEFFAEKKYGDNSERLETLARYDCNPLIELEKFRASVSIPKPQSRPTFEKVQGFDPGVITQKGHFAHDPDIVNVLPAFAFLKMTEVIGFPLVCGRVHHFSDEISYAANWIEGYDPLWAMSIISRSASEEIIEGKFQRLAIFSVNENTFNAYYDLGITSLKQSLLDYYRNGRNQNFDSTFSYRQIQIQLEILSRLSIRLSEDRLGELLDIAMNIYKYQNIAPQLAFYGGIDRILKRCSLSGSQQIILDRLESLLNLPIPSNNQFIVPYVEHFPEPFASVQFREDFKIPDDYNRNSWENQISNLIQISKTGTPDERRRALLRLIRICKIGGLTASENEELKTALWGKVDPISHLPKDIGYYNYVLLELPKLTADDTKEKYRKWLVNQSVPSSFTRTILPNGKTQTTKHGGGGQLTSFVMEWIYSSKRLQLTNTEDNECYIDWSDSEILALFNNISKIWNEQKSWLQEYKEKEGYFYTELLDEYKEIFLLFEQVIVFNLNKITDSNAINQILTTIDEFSKYDVCINGALPGILSVKPEEAIIIDEQLRKGLFSTNSEVSTKSIDGIYNYALLTYHKKVPTINKKIISDFIYSIILRKEPGLSHALDIVSELIKEYPDLFEESHIDDLLLSIEEFITPLNHNAKKFEYTQNTDMHISDNEYEAIQRNIIKVVRSLQQYYIKAGKKSPDLLTKISVRETL